MSIGFIFLVCCIQLCIKQTKADTSGTNEEWLPYTDDIVTRLRLQEYRKNLKSCGNDYQEFIVMAGNDEEAIVALPITPLSKTQANNSEVVPCSTGVSFNIGDAIAWDVNYGDLFKCSLGIITRHSLTIGSGATSVIARNGEFCGAMVTDSANQLVYWSPLAKPVIYRIDRNGKQSELVLQLQTARDHLVVPLEFFLDITEGQLFWIGESAEMPPINAEHRNTKIRVLIQSAKIQRHAKPSPVNTLIVYNIQPDVFFRPHGLTGDIATKHIFWCDNSQNAIMQADYDGKNVQMLFTLEPATLSAYNLFYRNGRIYWQRTWSGQLGFYNISANTSETV